MYTNTLINVTKKRKSKSIINNTEYHDTRNDGKAVAGGSQIAEYRIYNTEIVPTVKGFNRYIKQHSHVGYNAVDEITDRKNDFVIPRITKDTCLMDTMIISPGFRIPASEEAIEAFLVSGDMKFFEDYINEFMANDPKLKNCKVLSAIVHFDEVHFPRSEYDENGKWVRDYTDEESLSLAYIPIHMHVNYLPLTKDIDKNGEEYLKLSHKEIWKSDRGRYWQSYKEFNDRQYEVVGKKYSRGRGNVWEDWKTRIQEAENGKKAKKKRELTDFIMDQEQKRVDGIKKQQAQLQEEVQTLELDVKGYQARIDRLKRQHIEAEQEKKRLQEELQQLENESFASFEKMQQSFAREIATKKAEHKKQIAQMDKEITDKKWELVHQIKEYSEQQLFDMFYIETEDGWFTTERFDEEIRKELQKQLIGKDGKPTQYALDLFKEIKNDPDIASLDAKLLMDKVQTYDRLLRMHGINPDERTIDNIGRDNR